MPWGGYDGITMWRTYLDPRPVSIVTSIEPEGRPNAITLGWSMPTSFQPPLLAISVGHTRYSHLLLERCREFVFNVPSHDVRDLAFRVGSCSGREVDKFAELSLTPVPARQVRPPAIAECMAAIECRIVDQMAAGDHTIFVGKVLEAYPLGEGFDVSKVVLQSR
jgi:flavin reductase (DIM6/NTAB) family NADH-FMN oxidoreductase RutF